MSGPRLARVAAADFDLQQTLQSGQVFHWQKCGNGFAGAIGQTPFYVEQKGAQLWAPAGGQQRARDYFALDHPLPEIYDSFPSDPAMNAALEFCRGIRVIRQPAWECLATFITSALKQMAHISRISLTIRERFGKPLGVAGHKMFAYPAPEIVAGLSERELRECKLGFRAKNLLGSAQMIAHGQVDLEKIRALDDDEARVELQRLPGVGPKIANCVLLFAYSRLRAFPIDVWIERRLREVYFPRKRRVTAERLRLFSANYFGPFGGYAQQYLFHHARVSSRGGV